MVVWVGGEKEDSWKREGGTHDAGEDKIQERFHITVVHLILCRGLIVAGRKSKGKSSVRACS